MRVNTRGLYEVRRNVCERITIGFGFTFLLLFCNISKLIDQRSNGKPADTRIDNQAKTALLAGLSVP